MKLTVEKQLLKNNRSYIFLSGGKMKQLFKLILILLLVFNFTQVTHAETGESLTFDQALDKIYQEIENEVTSKDLADLALNELRELKKDRLDFVKSMQDKLDQINDTYGKRFRGTIVLTAIELVVLVILLTDNKYTVKSYVKALTPGGIALAGSFILTNLSSKDYYKIEKAIEIANQNITLINSLIKSKEDLSD